MEKLRTDLILEALDRSSHHRSAGMHLFGSLSEATGAGHGYEMLQERKLDHFVFFPSGALRRTPSFA